MDLSFIDKLNQEYNELDKRIIKLERFMRNNQVDKQEKIYLLSQLEYMKNYREVLNKRYNYSVKKYRGE